MTSRKLPTRYNDEKGITADHVTSQPNVFCMTPLCPVVSLVTWMLFKLMIGLWFQRVLCVPLPYWSHRQLMNIWTDYHMIFLLTGWLNDDWRRNVKNLYQRLALLNWWNDIVPPREYRSAIIRSLDFAIGIRSIPLSAIIHFFPYYSKFDSIYELGSLRINKKINRSKCLYGTLCLGP